VIEIYILPRELRKKLKEPLGTLIAGNLNETAARLKELIEKENPTKLVSVGDAVTKSMIEHGILPNVFIVDNKVMRKSVTPLKATSDQTFFVENPAGTISEKAWSTLEMAMSKPGRTRIVVEGEEDLLTLVAILSSPPGSLVVYGQPHEGIVAVKVTEAKKKEVEEIVEAFHRVPSKS